MSGAIPSLPHTSSWRGASFRTGTTLPLPLAKSIYLARNISLYALQIINMTMDGIARAKTESQGKGNVVPVL
jgi:hypothetical protein